MDMKASIEATKKGFEKSFDERIFYNRQTQDAEHLERIVKALKIKDGSKVLDLGTGTGYVAFEIANKYNMAQVIGLDIVEEALKENRKKVAEKRLQNIDFISYDGMTFPFEDDFFDVIVTRYSLHHFPDIEHTFQELARVLKKGGQLFIVDPTPNDDDKSRFVDAYMRMKPDGHIKYYTKDEFCELAQSVGMILDDEFETSITFPRLTETAYGFDDIMKSHSEEIISGYNVWQTEDKKYIYITQRVWNLSFIKQ